MNSKPTILVSENQTVFQTPFLEEIWKQYFNVEILDVNKNYDKRSTVVVSAFTALSKKISDFGDFFSVQDTNKRILVNKGIRHVVDQCWDSWSSVWSCRLDNSADFILRPRDFVWINESIWYKHLGYDKFNLTSNPTRDFLLLMNLIRSHRTKLYNRLLPVLPNNIYSYVGNNIPLQNAQDQEYNTITWQRYIDPSWYTDTRFSIVCETTVFDKTKLKPNDDINVTEKTLKPCAFKHPSIVWGQTGTLAWQKRQGFETFEHCVDESYDTVEDADLRFEKVVEQIELCIADKTIFTDPLTKQKLEHNYNHFYNEELVMKLMHEQIINPLLEFINA
jgi:hypothetical protein